MTDANCPTGTASLCCDKVKEGLFIKVYALEIAVPPTNNLRLCQSPIPDTRQQGHFHVGGLTRRLTEGVTAGPSQRVLPPLPRLWVNVGAPHEDKVVLEEVSHGVNVRPRSQNAAVFEFLALENAAIDAR
ncbi:hypothetical protein B0H13DRAFT_1933447 [Mycena leptocephala]|nr:hypothetical protein B0H13DRAFT_1933447 [Mycena leptocephala]